MNNELRIEKIYSTFFSQAFPGDLALVIAWLVICIATIFIPFLNATPVRIVFVLPVVFFLPGYCLIAALFPKNDDINLGERIALSIGLSLSIIPLIGFGLNFTSWGIQLEPIVILLILLIWVLILVAHYRRAIIPIEERFRMPFSEISRSIREGLFPPDRDRVDLLLSIILAIVIIVAITTTIYVIASPKESEHFSEFFNDYQEPVHRDTYYEVITQRLSRLLHG